jgi:glyoxylase-like metal-dependent hydrolase (beta-lactamase superfamily II)
LQLRAASALIVIGLFASAPIVHPQEQKPRSPELELLPVQGNVSMVAGAGGNITVQVGKDGVLLVDTGMAAMTDKVLQAIRTVSNRQITYIINTDERSDHIGGNATIAKLGQPLAIARAAQASVFIVAFSTILDRMSASTGQASVPESAWPNDTYSVPQKNLSFNGEAVQIFHQPATTDGNSIVVFRRSDVISTGRYFRSHAVPDHRREERRKSSGRARGIEPPETNGRSGRPRGRRYDDRPRPRKDL